MRDRCLRTQGEPITYADKTSATDYLLEGLEPYSTYTIYVTASNQAGNGTRAAIVAETKETGLLKFLDYNVCQPFRE